MSDIRRWLEELGLGQYADAFEENAIGVELLARLDDQALKDLGVSVMGHRIRILDAIVAPPGDGEQPERQTAREAATTEPAKAAVPEAERRQLTVMFCDLVGSTALSAKLDPEELREVMAAYQKTAGDVIERYEGHVAQYLGDGLMTYFGWPRAHEDDAQRAIRAALEIIEAVDGLDTPVDLSIRIGVATGPVVVGDSRGDDRDDAKLAVGETPNLAARIQGAAAADTVLIADATRRLLGGTFELDDLGSPDLKGIDPATTVYRVIGETVAESRFEAAHAAGMTPFVGRQTETTLLAERWSQAKDGEGQVVLLCGEPGIGKSRITQELRERLAGEPHTRLRYQCSPYHANSAFHPIIEQLQRAAGFARDDTPETKLDKLERVLAQATNTVAAVAPLVAAMLSLPIARYPPLNLPPQKQKENTIAALADQALGLAAREPVLMIFEDAHWSDPTTLEALGAIIDRIQDAAVLMVIAYRPEFAPPWTGYGHVTGHTLNRLGRKLGADMVAKVTGAKALPDEVLDQIVAKTDGIPLFVEELTKAVLEAGFLTDEGGRYTLDGPLPPLAIPATLRDSLMARLDRLSPVKEVAQIGACIGREFSYDLLAAVSPFGDNGLQEALQRLVNSELIFRRGAPPEASYTFKHAMIQDAAYESLLKGKRQTLHRQIAEQLEARAPEDGETKPELLAHHYTAATLADRAVPYWLAAGKQAVSRSANQEAIAHLRHGLELLPALPESPERDRHELHIKITLGPPLIHIKGYQSSDTISAYERAHKLSLKLGEREELSAILFGLWVINNTGAKHSMALDWADQALEHAAQDDNVVALMIARRLHGMTLLHTGYLREANTDLEKSIALYDPDRHRDLAYRFAQDPEVAAGVFLSWTMWLQGYADQALRTADKASNRAKSIKHTNTSLWALCYGGAFIASWCGHLELAEQNLRDLTDQSKVSGILLHEMSAKILNGWLQAKKGIRDLTNEMQDALANLHGNKFRLWTPVFLSMMSESHLGFGRADAGKRLIDQALAFVAETEERMTEAELHRIKGACLGAIGNDAGAEESYVAAIAVARRQHAKSWELRAATSLAGLWQSQGRRKEAQDLLAPVYNWFTEGFDTADLKDAKALLEELK